jgi:hypothetical protein
MAHGSLVANGNVTPSSIVILDSTAPGRGILASSATATVLWGISQEGQWRTAWAALQDGFCAIKGSNFNVFINPDTQCLLKIGGTVTAGDYLTSDANGLGITTTTTGNWVIAQALASGVANDLITVKLVPSLRY